MRRDTLAFTLAGIVFGFVAGYMTAGWESSPRPVALGATTPASGSPAAPGASAPARPSFDANEAKALETLAAKQPGDAATRVELGNMYMDAQRWDEAIRWYGEALRIAPGNPEVATDMGACYVSSGRPAEGLALFEGVLKLNPDHRNARFNLGVALQQLGRAREAAEAWEDLLRRHPDDAQLQRLRGRIDEIRAVASPASGSGKTP